MTQIIGSSIIYLADFRPKGILVHYYSCIEASISNDIAFFIAIKNITHLFFNEFILVLFRKYGFLHFHSIVKN